MQSCLSEVRISSERLITVFPVVDADGGNAISPTPAYKFPPFVLPNRSIAKVSEAESKQGEHL
jgi:hypothetical protein